MHVILATFGTDGDVFPYLGLGAELARRGHDTSLVTSGHYEATAVKNGLNFRELMPREAIDRVLANPDFWHPLKSGPLAAKWGREFIPRHYALLSQLVKKEETVLIANPAVLAARLLHERQRTPFVSLVLQPWVIPSAHNPPYILGGLSLPRRAPRWLWKLYFRAVHLVGDLLIGRQLNRFRAELGLPPIKRVLDWWLSPQLVLGLFPAWFGPPQPDWPKQIRLLSFPTFDGSWDAPLPPALDPFLRDGEPPVAITFGTGIRHAAALYKIAIQACARLGRRAIVITKYPEQIPHPLPDGIVTTSYAPFSKLFPRCAAVLHHGGIGTTAKALASHVPQLIVPFCFDQLDNAQRLKILGCGLWLAFRSANQETLTRELRATLRMTLPIEKNRAAVTPAFTRAAEIVESLGAP